MISVTISEPNIGKHPDLSYEAINTIDKSGLHAIYGQWPAHASDAWRRRLELPEFDIDEIIFAGMGASGIIGEVICDWLYGSSDYGFNTVHQPTLPKRKNSRRLLFAISASGNTWEVMSAVKHALKMDWKVLAMSEGGELEEFSRKNGIPHVSSKKFEVPRASFPDLLYAAIRALHEIGIIDYKGEVEESIVRLQELQQFISADSSFDENISKELAYWLHGGIPVIYASALNHSVGNRFKNGINENAKIHAFVNEVPEMCHNEIMSWEEPSKYPFKPVLLRDKFCGKEISQRLDVVADVLKNAGYSYSVVWADATSKLPRLTSAIYALDLASIYLAVANGTDPRPTHTIDSLKERLSSRALNIA